MIGCAEHTREGIASGTVNIAGPTTISLFLADLSIIGDLTISGILPAAPDGRILAARLLGSSGVHHRRLHIGVTRRNSASSSNGARDLGAAPPLPRGAPREEA
jgi:hypothetical protein